MSKAIKIVLVIAIILAFISMPQVSFAKATSGATDKHTTQETTPRKIINRRDSKVYNNRRRIR